MTFLDTQTLPNSTKKNASEWFIGGIFFIVSGLFVPVAAGVLLLEFGLMLIDRVSPAMLGLIGSFITYILIHESTRFIAPQLKQRYVQRNSKKVAWIAVLYFVLIMIPWQTYNKISMLSDVEFNIEFFVVYQFLYLCIFATALYKGIKHYY